MRAWGIDVGTDTALVLLSPERVLLGYWLLRATATRLEERADSIALACRDILGRAEAGDICGIEAPRVDYEAIVGAARGEALRKSMATSFLWRVAVRLAEIAGERGARIVLVEPAEGHMALYGRRRGDKEAALRMARVLWPQLRELPTTAHHIADACGVALRALAEAQSPLERVIEPARIIHCGTAM